MLKAPPEPVAALDDEDRARRIRYEESKWSGYFEQALKGAGQEHEDSLWWRISDIDSLKIVEEFVDVSQPFSVCEPACGSGGTTALLARTHDLSEIALLDISPTAIAFARSILPAELRSRARLIVGDAFAMPVKEDRFDLTWNVGVIEHYLEPQIVSMVGEMLRVTRPGGVVMVALPNRLSVATLKAALLGSRFGRQWLTAIPGYRFDSEILYGTGRLVGLLERNFSRPVHVRYAGNALWVGAPELLVRFVHRLTSQSPFSFLAFLVLRK